MSAELLERIDDAAAGVRERLGTVPPVLVIAGSGLGEFAKQLTDQTAISYADLRHFPVSTVQGHAGTLVRGKSGSRDVLVMNGRKHLYEGADPRDVTLPLRALITAGVRTLIVSNAAGGLNPKFDVGDLMLITDHINFQFQNPLIGPNLDRMGPRFPDMSEPYSRRLQKLARETARELGINLREGVYLGGLGPSYETRAEVQVFRTIADVVGMSTVLETIVAVHAGVEVLGITCVTNTLVNSAEKTTHEEVMDVGRKSGLTFCRLVHGVIDRLPA